MKFKIQDLTLIPLVLILSLASALQLAGAETPTDAELLELERQIQLQELEQKNVEQQAVEEARRKTEEQKLKQEQARLDEERRKLEEEKERIEAARKSEEVARLKSEENKRKNYNELMTSGMSAMEGKQKQSAITYYQQALVLYPGDREALAALKEAEALLDEFCLSFIGTWQQPGWGGDTVIFYEDGRVSFKSTVVAYENQWYCDPVNKLISMDILNNVRGAPRYRFKLSDNRKQIHFADRNQDLYLEKVSDNN